MMLATFDFNGAAAMIIALTGLVGALGGAVAWLWSRIKELRDDYTHVWHGIVSRGFLEAQECGMLKIQAGKWVISVEAKFIYGDIIEELKTLFKKMQKLKGAGELEDEEFAFAIEQDKKLQEWMLKHACPALKLNTHGCLAIACVMTRDALPADEPKPPEKS